MASIAAMPPTPQHSFTQMVPAGSPQGPSSQPNGAPYGHGYNLSFDSQLAGQPVYSQGFPNGPVSNPGYLRSFGDGYGPVRDYAGKPQIYTAVYSGVSVYEMEIGGVACMRRRSDGWLNATQILKVAGVDKGKRTKVLEKEILTGEHEKVQGGYGKYQGTWISYRRGREFCRQYGVEDILRPLLDYDVTADGSGGHGQETPTKEQAMAANRKRFYNTNLDSRPPQGGPVTNGTFFSNISPTTSVALAAMNKAARLQSPAPRPPSAQRPANVRPPSQQDAFPGSQQSAASQMSSDADAKFDSGYSTQPNGTEPPRKRMRHDSQDGMGPPNLPLDVSMRSVTPTEPNESFFYDGGVSHELTRDGEPIAQPPHPAPSNDEQQEKLSLVLDLFADAGRSDYATHEALTRLSGEDLNMPLDQSANNALHWAATLAKVPLLKLLIQKGANIWRGNAAGQSPLISAVLVNNCWENSCFPELLELFGPLIEVRDAQGRTILHHIAVSSGIKGRAPSSKYYLEALLEYLVRIGTQPSVSANHAGAPSVAAAAVANMKARANGDMSSQESAASAPSHKGALTLVRFLSHIVNARDKAGNTALNLVARIGNRSIIQQLLEIHADPNMPNNKGVSAKDFGVGLEPGEQPYANGGLSSQQYTQQPIGTQDTMVVDGESDGVDGSGARVEDMGHDMLETMSAMLSQNLTAHKELLRVRTEQIDQLNVQIRNFSALQKADLEHLQQLKERVKLRSERQAQVANLKRAIAERRTNAAKRTTSDADLDNEWLDHSSQDILASNTPGGSPNASQRHLLENRVPSPKSLRATLNAYVARNEQLRKQADELKSRSSELEGMYRKVVSLCTNVPEDKVEESLPALVAAVESERGAFGEQEAGRLRDFLRRVDGAVGGGGGGIGVDS
ncbi:hypothetical protein BAUCODRAFT_471495 [Baudoinia panamericana UAMH 10762]|uniref:HTH APSES-type domain-containing protein n=1 Tax=Baudoinia panamericana (strain UAMH 10762) TaxID=717646 RepID=M2MI53_BAUPA|nr:uncharacterized protein BAUCODRAFT_471495 [Baudoinia panamericana UAMH 10762]EMC96341.1 hypothetical protein BAUCODRAFT_471495 [Baudoinia panamericana UAMH 10762]